MRPGEKLSDHKLAQHLGVSRTPVREALKRLEDKGLVEIAANRWTRVARISLDQAGLIYPVISSLESLALSLAKLETGDLDRMDELNRELKTAIQERDPVAASRADAGFHQVIIQAAQNHYITTILDDLKIQHRRLEVQYFQEDIPAKASVREHELIIEALRRGDLTRAQGVMRDNWAQSLDRLRGAARDESGPEGE